MKLSIIIPCYNCEKTLKEAVDSCYLQGFSVDEFEIVMVDDGSTDNTRELIKSICTDRNSSGNNNIKFFFHEKNMGGGATRNTAVANSQGEVIFGLDSDDILPDGTLLKMYSYLKEKGCDGVSIHKSIKFIGSDTKNINNIDESVYTDKKIPLTSLFSNKEEFRPLYVTFMYTKVAFEKTGGYPTGHGYDTQGFGWRFLCAGLNAYSCPKSEYLHRVKANESYFLREYNNGKINYNWRNILLEHYYIFNEKTLEFIRNFNCQDFTRNIMDELIEMKDILVPNVESVLGKKYPPLPLRSIQQKNIKRRSLKGYYFRIRHKLKNLFNKKQ